MRYELWSEKKNQRWPKGLNLIIKTNDSEMIKMRKIRERFESRNTMHSVLVVSVVWCLLNSQMEYVVHQIIEKKILDFKMLAATYVDLKVICT